MDAHWRENMKKMIPCLLILCSVFFFFLAMDNPHSRDDSRHSRHWQSGQYLPQRYHDSHYAIDHRRVRHLPQPGRHQQWYRIDHQYVLINTHDHRIVRTHR